MTITESEMIRINLNTAHIAETMVKITSPASDQTKDPLAAALEIAAMVAKVGIDILAACKGINATMNEIAERGGVL